MRRRRHDLLQACARLTLLYLTHSDSLQYPHLQYEFQIGKLRTLRLSWHLGTQIIFLRTSLSVLPGVPTGCLWIRKYATAVREMLH